MAMDDFQIELVAGLDGAKSKSQLNSDIEALKKQLNNVEIEAKIGKDVVTNVTKQLNAAQITLKNVEIDQSAINKMVSQINSALSGININLGEVVSGNGQQIGRQFGQQVKNGIQSAIQVFNTKDLKANNIAYMSKVYNTIAKQMVEIDRLASKNNWSDVKVSGMEQADGKIQQLTLTVRDAEGALKQFNMQREKLQGNGKVQAGLVQTGDVKVLETATQYAEKLANIKLAIGENGKTTTAISTLGDSFKKLGLSSDEVKQKLENVHSEFETLQHYVKNDASGTQITTQFEKLNSVLNQTQNDLRQTRSEMSVLATDQSRLSKAESLQKWADNNTKAMKKYGNQVTEIINQLKNLDEQMTVADSKQLSTQISKIKDSTRTDGLLGMSGVDKLKNAWSKFGGWSLATGSLMSAVNQVRSATDELKDLDDILTEISKTSDSTKSELKQLGNEAFDSASKYGRNASDWLTGVQEMNRSGFYGEQGKALADTSALAQSAGDMTAEVANNWILATNAAYKYEAEASKLNAVLDGVNEVTNRNSVNMTDMADAMTVVGSNAANAGVKVNELSSIIGTAVATTKKSGSEVGTALKSIFVNLQNTGSSKIIGTLEKANSSMTEKKNGIEELRSPITILKELAKTYNSLDEKDPLRAEITRNIGGKYYANILGSILDNFDQYNKMLNDYAEGTGSAEEEAAKSANNWTGSLNRLSNSWTKLVSNFANSDAIVTGINILNSGIKVVDKLTSGSKLLTTALAGAFTAFQQFNGGGLADPTSPSLSYRRV